MLRVEIATAADGRSVLFNGESRFPLEERRERSRTSYGQTAIQWCEHSGKVKSGIPEPELRDEEAWEKERKTRWHKFNTP
jgi:hypothetical protein